MMKILKNFIIILCINQYFCLPIENRRQFNNLNNFQEVKLHFPVQEIPILYPVQTQNYETFNNPYANFDFTGFEPQATGVKDREELITPKPQSESQSGRLIDRNPVRYKTPINNVPKELKNHDEYNEGSFEERQPNPEYYQKGNNPTNYHFENTKIKETYELPSQKQHSDSKNIDSSDFDSSHEDLLDHGYDENFEENSKKEKEHLEQKYQDDYAEDGEEEDSGFDKEQYKKDSGNYEKEGRDEKFLEKEGHKKGHKTKGYNNKFHRDEIHREHKFYDDDKPNYKDQKVEKSEIVAKKKINKDLDTYKEIFDPKYSVQNLGHLQHHRRQPRGQFQSPNPNYLEQHYKKQPAPQKNQSVPPKNPNVLYNKHLLQKNHSSAAKYSSTPKNHKLHHKNQSLSPKSSLHPKKYKKIKSKTQISHQKNRTFPPKTQQQENSSLHHKPHFLVPKNYSLYHKHNFLTQSNRSSAPNGPIAFHENDSLSKSSPKYYQLHLRGNGNVGNQNPVKFKRANVDPGNEQHLLIPIGASILVADDSKKGRTGNAVP